MKDYPSEEKNPSPIYRRGHEYPFYVVLDPVRTPQEPLPPVGPPNDGSNPNYPTPKV